MLIFGKILGFTFLHAGDFWLTLCDKLSLEM